MTSYRLSAVLEGHTDDVRGVVFPRADMIVSASRDGTVRVWRRHRYRKSNGETEDAGPCPPPSFEGQISSTGESYMNSVSYVGADAPFPDGLIVAGGRDGIIDVRSASKPMPGNAEALLVGHTANVCTLYTLATPDTVGGLIASGSWDNTARVWRVGNWGESVVLKGHEASVWAVIIYDMDTIITGCADKMIRIFDLSGRLRKLINGGGDVVRALSKIGEGQACKGDFASAGNDGLIRLWRLDGERLGELAGHESFIYSLVTLGTGELVSSSEDRTVRIWRGKMCIQTITLPAISVWCVSVCSGNGDLVTGSSDGVIRVFTRDAERIAARSVIQEFEESLRSWKIASQTVDKGKIKADELPTKEYLENKLGSKEGQVQMIREKDGSVSAYQWTNELSQWIMIGTVTDSIDGGGSEKITYEGKDYDFVFDVDIEDGKPTLKLPYNIGEDAAEVAREFLEKHQLPGTYLEQTTRFIESNAKVNKRGGVRQAEKKVTEGKEKKMLPQREYVVITTGNLEVIEEKLKEFREKVKEKLEPRDIEDVKQLMDNLKMVQKGKSGVELTKKGVGVMLKMAYDWPLEYRLPVLDVIRLCAAYGDVGGGNNQCSESRQGADSIMNVLMESGVFQPDVATNISMMGFRVVANLFATQSGERTAWRGFEKVEEALRSYMHWRGGNNRENEGLKPEEDREIKLNNVNLTRAIATVLLNYSILFSVEAGKFQRALCEEYYEYSLADRQMSVLEALLRFISDVKGDDEGIYRALVGIGTLIVSGSGEELIEMGVETMAMQQVVENVKSATKDERVERVVEEIGAVIRAWRTL